MSDSRRGFIASLAAAFLAAIGRHTPATDGLDPSLPVDHDLREGGLNHFRSTEYTYDSQGRLLSVVVRYSGHG